jgi:predicted dehydrogenase
MSGKQWNIGVIGYGLSAKIFHIPFINDTPELKLYAIVQRTPKPGDDASKDHPNAKVYRNTEELFKDDDLDAVVINTTPPSHFELARNAIQHGKHGKRIMLIS